MSNDSMAMCFSFAQLKQKREGLRGRGGGGCGGKGGQGGTVRNGGEGVGGKEEKDAFVCLWVHEAGFRIR